MSERICVAVLLTIKRFTYFTDIVYGACFLILQRNDMVYSLPVSHFTPVYPSGH